MKSFKERQYDYQYDVAHTYPDWFNGDKCGGIFRSRQGLPDARFILNDGNNNLYKDIRYKVIDYFEKNKIGWWAGKEPSGHMCSSQIACLNHLFPFRHNPQAVLALANAIAGENYFDDVQEVGGDSFDPGYIAFEVVTSKDYLFESNNKKHTLSRGSQCTSIDALIMAKRKDSVFLLPIEWKFAEEYGRDDKSRNPKKEGKESKSGDKRIRSYFDSNLVAESDNLKFVKGSDPHGCVYFQEPFYQLMRQTLWVERTIKNKDVYFKNACDYLHVHIVPNANKTLRNKIFRKVEWDNGGGMVATWKSNLKDPNKYKCIDPKELFSLLLKDQNLKEQYKKLIEYLNIRYWVSPKRLPCPPHRAKPLVN